MKPVNVVLRAGAGLAAIAAAALLVAPGCTATATNAPVKALQSAGPTVFVCLGDPASGTVADFAMPLGKCPRVRADGFGVPHLYALTTQPIRGEVAVIDLTTTGNALIDSDPATPGTNFLPVGAAPTDLVATPGGMATFVTVGEPGYEGIYALPSGMIRGGAPLLSDWPACALPATPSHVALVVDPADKGGATRPACDAAYGAPDPAPGCGPKKDSHCHGDLTSDAVSAGNPGRYKLVITLPKAGGIAVVDAQAILDQEAGAFKPCRVERFVPLTVAIDQPVVPPPEAMTSCVQPAATTPKATAYVPLPAGITAMTRSSGGASVFIADRVAPEIHRVDMPTPCEPKEVAPLLPTSVEDPTRVVTTTRVVVSPLTLDLRRFLYAIDEVDGSMMVFDVSEGATGRNPLRRAHPEWNPFQPSDRIRFGSPPRDVVLARHAADLPDADTGATLPVRCDPTPNAMSQGAKYQTASDFSSGAGPRKLRGVFAFAILASGSVVTIDVDDFDAPCRGPVDHHPLFGCGDKTKGLAASTEYTCNAVAPHQPRANAYLAFRENVGSTQPGLQTFPILFDVDGTVLDPSVMGVPRMRATTPADPPPIFAIPVGTDRKNLDPATGLLLSNGQPVPAQQTLMMNDEDPRAHIFNQSWTVVFEGGLPGFSGHFGSLVAKGAGFELTDPSLRFCARGVQGAGAVHDLLVEREGASDADAAKQAQGLADYVQIVSDTPVASDKYWSETTSCTFASCQQTYGTSINPAAGRDFRIDVAREDALEIAPRAATPSPGLKCCFPNVVQYRVRAGGQWVVIGSQVGFLHHVDADPTGVCRPKCDPTLARLNGRVRQSDKTDPVKDGDPRAFINPFFRFAINQGTAKRDAHFDFATQSAFVPLLMNIIATGTDVQPTSASFLPVTGELVVSDGSLNGVVFIDIGALAVSRQYQ